jgi:ribonuclease Z
MDLCFFGTSGAIPTTEDGNVSFVLRSHKTAVLVDLSGNPVQNLLRGGIDPLTLDAVVMTHAHPDHLYAFPSLIQTLWLLRRVKPLVLLSNPPTAGKARKLLSLFNLGNRELMFELIWRNEVNRAIPVSSFVRLTLFPVVHSLPTSGIRIDAGSSAVVFSADTAPCPALLEAARGCKALIHEASGPEERREQLNEAGHSTGAQAGEIAAQTGVEFLYLCHFDWSGDAADSAARQMKSEAQKKFSGSVVIPEIFCHYQI